MAGVPFVFGNATTSIPLSNLDANFNTGVTIGNTTVGLGNTVTTLGNVTLTNATVSSASITDSGLTSGRAVYTGTGGLLSANANLTYDGTTFTAVNDASISGLTVGKGGGATTYGTAFGYQALNNASNSGSVLAVGYQAGFSNTTGADNTALGSYRPLYANTAGGFNTAIGREALTSNTTGSYNVAVGNTALSANTTASNNTAVGYQAGFSNTTGAGNTFLGYVAGYGGTALTTGSNNTYIGYNAQASAAASAGEMVLSTSGLVGKGNNTTYIANACYQGNNSATWSITSDQRLKKNIVDNTTGLDAITKIQVRNFEYRTADEVTDLPVNSAIDIKGVQLGAIAQELKEILPDCVKTESTGVMSVDASNLTWYLINAVKELNAKVTALENK